MVKPADLTLDQVLYNVVLMLLLNEHTEAGLLLLESELEEVVDSRYDQYRFDEIEWSAPYVRVILAAPHALQPKIGSSDVEDWFISAEDAYAARHPIIYQMQKAFEVVLRQGPVLIQSYVQLTVDSEENWREHLREVAQGKRVTNQGRQFGSDNGKQSIIVWERLYFRSQAEKKIAEELDKRAVLFFPNCAARLGTSEYRHNKEPDFLICHEGKWGILEVDGNPYHQRPAVDNERDRLFQQHGVRVVTRFTDTECRNHPAEVIAKFLAILERNG